MNTEDIKKQAEGILAGSKEKAAGFYEEAEKQGWTAISMANDWATIYGEGVTKTELPGLAKEEEAELDQAA